MSVLSQLGGTKRRWAGRWVGHGAAALLGLSMVVTAGLSACGGGTAQIQAFKPARLIVLGDETSVLIDDGASNAKKYSISNWDATTSVRDCLLLPLWVQALSTHYSFVFAECNKAAATPAAFMRAKVGGKVEGAGIGLAAQLAAQTSADSAVKAGDLFSVMIGANDLFELADRLQAGTLNAANATTEARRRGAVLANQINALLATGARGIVATVPDVGLSPYVKAMETTRAGAIAQVTALTYEFNAALRTTIDSSKYDGRNYGLVLADDLVLSMSKNPAVFALSNVDKAVCAVALPDCTSATADLITDGVAASFLWADNKRLASNAQGRIGTQAVARAQGNPF